MFATKNLSVKFLRTIFFIMILLCTQVTVSLADAPDKCQKSPDRYITRIDTTNFPEVRIWVKTDNHDNLEELLHASILKEDGVEQTIEERKIKQVNLQIAIVIDNQINPSLPTEWMKRLEKENRLSSNGEYLFTVIKSGKTATTLKDWTYNVHEAIDAISNCCQNNQNNTNADLLYAVSYAIDQFSAIEGTPQTTQKIIIIFSSGKGTSDAETLDDIYQKAQKQHVQIYTALLGKWSSNEVPLQQLSACTNGQYLSDLNNMAFQHNQLVFEYRSSKARPKEIQICTSKTCNEAFTKRFPLLMLKPAQIGSPQIITNTLIIKRYASAYNTPLSAMEPLTAIIPINYRWTDGYTRTIKHLEYIFNGEHYTATGTTDAIVLPLSTLSKDTFLQITAIDELGIKNTSKMPVQVTLVRPARPIWLMGVWGVGVLATILVIYGGGKFLQKKHTEYRQQKLVKATLGLTDNNRQPNHKLPKIIEIHQGVTKIGRDKNWATVVIDHPKISRKHCTISEESDGVFRIKDEGSHHGTSVNHKTIEPGSRGYILKTGDQIQIATFEYEIKIAGGIPEQKSKNDVIFSTDE